MANYRLLLEITFTVGIIREPVDNENLKSLNFNNLHFQNSTPSLVTVMCN